MFGGVDRHRNLVWKGDKTMFDFRIVNLPDGAQVIDPSVKTPVESLTPEMQLEYMEVSRQITYSEIMVRKQRRKQEHERKAAKNPLHKLACLCRLA